MKKRQFQLSEFLLNSAIVFAIFLLCVFFIFHAYVLFQKARIEYDSLARQHATYLVLRGQSEAWFVSSFAKLVPQVELKVADPAQKLEQFPLFSIQSVPTIDSSGKVADASVEFFRQAELFSIVNGFAWHGVEVKGRRFLISSDGQSLFGASQLSGPGFAGGRGDADKQVMLRKAGVPIFKSFSRRATKSLQGSAVWIPVYVSAFDSKLVSACYSPIFNLEGHLVAYAVSEVSVSDLVEHQTLQKYGMQLVLHDPAGNLVFSDASLKEEPRVAAKIGVMDQIVRTDFDWKQLQLMIFFSGNLSHWRMTYVVPLSAMVAARAGGIAASLVLFVFGLVSILWTAGQIRRHVIEPSRENAERFVRGRDLLQTLMELSPVALCLLQRKYGVVLIQNELSRELLKLEVRKGDARWSLRDFFLALPPAEAREPGVIEAEIEAHPPGGSQLQHLTVKLIEVQHEGLPALFCAFYDNSDRKNAELALASAKSAADAANKAKSAF
ncbi:hypothetical protein, partial [Jeongeupia chitinilytica]|uniref:hypothetical protein n=1 Tax=Jeongeupia chitinilytica TaxID=1041641 RepID=UPI0016735516